MASIYNDPVDRPYPPTVQASVWPSALKWGAIAGAAGCILTLISFNLGMMDIGDDGSLPSTWPVTVLSLLIYGTLIYIGLKGYRDAQNAGFLTLGRGVLWSLGFGVGLALVTVLFTYLFYTVIAPEFIETMLDAQIDAAAEQGLSEQEIEQSEAFMEMFMSPTVLALSSAVGAVLMSLIIGLVVSLVVRRNP